jgi:hypothetical protein
MELTETLEIIVAKLYKLGPFSVTVGTFIGCGSSGERSMGPQDFRRIVLAHELVCPKEQDQGGETSQGPSAPQGQANKADAQAEQARDA